ncbi:MAG TPA: tetratricopeptide repeat protein [Candidatus Brocadiia bacterium]|nr:tetratricopeptide repeat protein [Planctomycetota bacterium]
MLLFSTTCFVIGCRGESSISKLKEQLEIEKKKREEESKKYVEVLNRLSEEMKRSEEQEKLITSLRDALETGKPQHGQTSLSMPPPGVESQDLPPPSQGGDRGGVELKTQDSRPKEGMEKLLQLANRFYWDGDYAVAKEIYDVVVELGNTDVDTLFRLAKCYGVTPETDKAISLYQKVIAALEHNDAANPLHHQAYNNLGGMYKKKGIYKEAELAYVKAIELDQEYTNAYYNLGLLYEENLDDELGAIRCYERYIELDGERSDYIKKKLDEIKAKD